MKLAGKTQTNGYKHGMVHKLFKKKLVLFRMLVYYGLLCIITLQMSCLCVLFIVFSFFMFLFGLFLRRKIRAQQISAMRPTNAGPRNLESQVLVGALSVVGPKENEDKKKIRLL